MALKAQKVKKEIANELEHFNKIGITASDKFYLNEDARKKREAKLKGGAKGMGEQIAGTYMDSLEMNRLRMKKEAEERIQVNVKMAEEDAFNKQKRLDDKVRLREV